MSGRLRALLTLPQAVWYRRSHDQTDIDSTYIRRDKLDRYHGVPSGSESVRPLRACSLPHPSYPRTLMQCTRPTSTSRASCPRMARRPVQSPRRLSATPSRLPSSATRCSLSAPSGSYTTPTLLL